MSSTDMILSQNCFLQVQRGLTKKIHKSFDAYGSTCMKFYEHILNGFKVVTETATYKFKGT